MDTIIPHFGLPGGELITLDGTHCSGFIELL